MPSTENTIRVKLDTSDAQVKLHEIEEHLRSIEARAVAVSRALERAAEAAEKADAA